MNDTCTGIEKETRGHSCIRLRHAFSYLFERYNGIQRAPTSLLLIFILFLLSAFHLGSRNHIYENRRTIYILISFIKILCNLLNRIIEIPMIIHILIFFFVYI